MSALTNDVLGIVGNYFISPLLPSRKLETQVDQILKLASIAYTFNEHSDSVVSLLNRVEIPLKRPYSSSALTIAALIFNVGHGSLDVVNEYLTTREIRTFDRAIFTFEKAAKYAVLQDRPSMLRLLFTSEKYLELKEFVDNLPLRNFSENYGHNLNRYIIEQKRAHNRSVYEKKELFRRIFKSAADEARKLLRVECLQTLIELERTPYLERYLEEAQKEAHAS